MIPPPTIYGDVAVTSLQFRCDGKYFRDVSRDKYRQFVVCACIKRSIPNSNRVSWGTPSIWTNPFPGRNPRQRQGTCRFKPEIIRDGSGIKGGHHWSQKTENNHRILVCTTFQDEIHGISRYDWDVYLNIAEKSSLLPCQGWKWGNCFENPSICSFSLPCLGGPMRGRKVLRGESLHLWWGRDAIRFTHMKMAIICSPRPRRLEYVPSRFFTSMGIHIATMDGFASEQITGKMQLAHPNSCGFTYHTETENTIICEWFGIYNSRET